MRKITAIVILCLLPSLSNSAQETKEISKNSNSSSTEDYTKFRFGGYGEMVANFKDYGINRFYGGNDGNPKKNRNTISIPRFVLAFDYKFSPKWVLSSEIEFEYGGTGAAREVEWYEENGEYETEIEKGGEVALEQFHISYLMNKLLNFRFGHMIVPVGLTNAHHEPLNFFGVYRPEGETTILPSTWHETGVALFGDLGNFDYELQVVSGLDPQGFRMENWVGKGTQGAFEVSQEIDFPFRGQLVRDVSLQIDKFRVVFCVCIHGTQNRPTAFKAETRYLGKFTDRTAYISIRTQQARGSRAFEYLRLFIGNIQHGTHLVSVTGLEATGGEIDRFCQVRIDKAKALLLSRANQKRTEYLDPIHINGI